MTLLEQSKVAKHSIVIGGHKTSISLEQPFWDSLKAIAKELSGGKIKTMTLSDLVGEIDTNRMHNNLSSACRLFVLEHALAKAKAAEVAPAETLPTGVGVAA